MVDAIGAVGAGILVFLIFLGMASPVLIICLFYYLKKRLEHKQVMAAIEKGVPFSTIKPPKPIGPVWIKNLTAGIALLIFSIGFIFVAFVFSCRFDAPFSILIVIILFALGISRIIRGLLQRNTEKQTLQPQNSNTDRFNKTASI